MSGNANKTYKNLFVLAKVLERLSKQPDDIFIHRKQSAKKYSFQLIKYIKYQSGPTLFTSRENCISYIFLSNLLFTPGFTVHPIPTEEKYDQAAAISLLKWQLSSTIPGTLFDRVSLQKWDFRRPLQYRNNLVEKGSVSLFS